MDSWNCNGCSDGAIPRVPPQTSRSDQKSRVDELIFVFFTSPLELLERIPPIKIPLLVLKSPPGKD